MTAKQVMQQYYSEMNAGRVDAAIALFAEDAVRLDTAMPGVMKSGKAVPRK